MLLTLPNRVREKLSMNCQLPMMDESNEPWLSETKEEKVTQNCFVACLPSSTVHKQIHATTLPPLPHSEHSEYCGMLSVTIVCHIWTKKDCSYIYRSNHIDIEISPFKLKIVSKFRKLQKVFHLVNICLSSHYFCIRKNQIMCFSSVMRSFATGVPLFA